MTAAKDQFLSALAKYGSDVVFHREEGGTPCPCRTPEGYRDPAWHAANPSAPVCNEQGFLADVTEFTVKASIQPAFTGLSRHAQRSNALLGEVERDDKIGIFPCEWGGNVLDFDDWSDAGEDYVVYDADRYLVVSADKLADIDGSPDHHVEAGLRRIKAGRPT